MLKVSIRNDNRVKVSIANERTAVSIPPTNYVVNNYIEKYAGDYSVTPDVEPIVLETKDKLMEDNVTVFKIPLWEVSNMSGTTIYIGGEEVYGN